MVLAWSAIALVMACRIHQVAYVGSTRIDMTVSAHNTNPAKGHVSYSNSTGKYFEGEVTGYSQVDSKSVFVGEVTESNYPKTQKYFKVWTYDAGEGEMMTEPDKFRVVLYTTPQLPTGATTTTYGASVVEGNI